MYFVAIGAALFLLYGAVSEPEAEGPQQITVAGERIAALAEDFERVWQRAPSPDELEALIDSWVREEVLYREGLAAGLDQDDTVVRRRVVQKMTFFAEGMAAGVPGDAELRAWFAKNAEKYRIEPSYSLRQVYFDPSRHRVDLEAVVERAERALQADAEARVGDPTMLPTALDDASLAEVTRTFGKEFAGALPASKTGAWSRVRSAFGVHLVRIDTHTPGRVPELGEVQQAVERDFSHQRTRAAVEDFYRTARARYTVRVERGGPDAQTSLAVRKEGIGDGT